MSLLPGHVLVVATGGWESALIRFGARLAGKPDMDNHVAVMHHYDTAGVPWGIEGRPGGVGWVDLRKYLNHPATVINTGQPLGNGGGLVARVMRQMLGTEYDWTGIAADAMHDLRLPELFAQDWHGKGIPGHVVCSSLAAYGYGKFGLPHPDLGHERFCQPCDWTAFIEAQAWEAAA